MTQSIEKIVSVSQKYGISSGIIAGDLEFVANWGRKGMSFLSYATGERILFDAAAKSVQQLRISIKPPEDL
jgi:20S proteasome alpha/beta subunit